MRADSSLRAGAALAMGGLSSLLYLSSLAYTQPADALAYTELAERGDAHPQHLLQHGLGWLVLQGRALVGAEVEALRWLSGLNALFGGAGVALATLLAVRAGAGLGLAMSAGAVLASSYSWWALSTTAEVHVLPVAVQVAAILVLVGGDRASPRPFAAGALQALAVLMHKTMVLALPALAVAALPVGARRARAFVLIASLGVALPYGAVMARGITRGDPWQGAATAWLMGEVAHRIPGAPPHQPWPVAASTGLAGSWVYTSAPRCGFREGWSGERLPAPGTERVPWRLTQLGGTIGAALALLGAVSLGRSGEASRRALVAALLGWPLLSVAGAFWFEPANFEYYLGALSCAVVLAAVGANALCERSPWPSALRAALVLGGLGTAVLVGGHNLERDIGPAMRADKGVGVCREGGPPEGQPGKRGRGRPKPVSPGRPPESP